MELYKKENSIMAIYTVTTLNMVVMMASQVSDMKGRVMVYMYKRIKILKRKHID